VAVPASAAVLESTSERPKAAMATAGLAHVAASAVSAATPCDKVLEDLVHLVLVGEHGADLERSPTMDRTGILRLLLFSVSE